MACFTRSSRLICSIVPPHLLRAIAQSDGCCQHAIAAASAALDTPHSLYDSQLAVPSQGTRPHGTGIVPGYLTSNIAESQHASDTARASVATTLGQHRGLAADKAATDQPEPQRTICDINHSTKERLLPGAVVREEGQASSSSFEKAVNDAYDNLGRVFQFYASLFGRNSVDGAGLPLIGTIHYGNIWELLFNFTGSLDVIGHELTHGVTQYTAKLEYNGQSGALNESVSDVFGASIRQYSSKQTAEEADWLIGEGCILPTVKGVALRSMKAPGTAYNDDKLGKDPQPDNMAEFQVLANDAEHDYGGVHINSGIPNRAYYLAAVGLGGNSWDKAAPIWYHTLLSEKMTPNIQFREFAEITCPIAKSLFSEAEADVVKKAWKDVGVL